jgi:hypothetical protein
VLIHTHYARRHDPRYDGGLLRRWLARRRATQHDYHLSPLTEHEGRAGRWYPEFPEGTDHSRFWEASYQNPRSFWLEKSALLEAIRTAGFPLVYEQHDGLRSMGPDDYATRHDRSLFVGVKLPPARERVTP